MGDYTGLNNQEPGNNNAGSVTSTASAASIASNYSHRSNLSNQTFVNRTRKANRNAIIQNLKDKHYDVDNLRDSAVYIAALEGKWVRNHLCNGGSPKSVCSKAQMKVEAEAMVLFEHLEKDFGERGKKYHFNVPEFWKAYGPNLLDVIQRKLAARESRSRPGSPSFGGRRRRNTRRNRKANRKSRKNRRN